MTVYKGCIALAHHTAPLDCAETRVGAPNGCWRKMSVRVFAPETPQELDQARDLIRAFNVWHRERHHEDLHLVDSYFDPDAFAAELAELPGQYAPPRGRLLLATYDGHPAGCVALREVD